MTILLTAIRDFRYVRRDRHRHLRRLRWPLLRLRLWCDVRKIAALPIMLPILAVVIVFIALEAMFGTLARGTQRMGEIVAQTLARVLGVERDEQWFRDLAARWPRQSRITTKKSYQEDATRSVCYFLCDGARIVTRSGRFEDVSEFLTCTAPGDDPEQELRVMWRNYACADDRDLDAEALLMKRRLTHVFGEEDDGE